MPNMHENKSGEAVSDQRILSAEQLERALWDVGDDKSECEIRLHIAALTEQHAAEVSGLKALPDSECWRELVVAAYKASDPPLLINRITREYNELKAGLARVTKERDEAANDLTQATLGFALGVKHLQAEITNAKQVHAMLRGQYDGMRTELRLNNEMHEAELAALKAELFVRE